MRSIIRLFNQSQFLTLTLIQTTLDAIRLLQLFQRQRQQLGIMFIIERRERNRLESSCFKPMNRHRIYSDTFFGRNVWPIFEIIMLTFLFRFEPNTSESSEI